MPSTDLCACGQRAETAHLQHLTQAEYDGLPETLRPIDGYAVKPVFTCWDCAPEPFCQHPEAQPVPCPVCHAEPGQPCVGPDGGTRRGEHRDRAEAQPQPEPCLHAHREDCDHRACQCDGDDPPPLRAPRIVGHAAPLVLPQQPATRPPDDMLLDAAAWMTACGINPALVRSEFRDGWTQDNRPAYLFDYAVAPDDGHGHEVVELRIEPIDGPTP